MEYLPSDQLEYLAPQLLGTKGTKNRTYLPPYAYQSIPLYSPLK